MQLSNTLLLAVLGLTSSTLAAPAAAKSMMTNTSWTITSLKRVCNKADTSCTWTFGIDNGSSNQACTLKVQGEAASEANGGPATCGPYTVTSGWSDQFGADNGFTTLSVVDNKSKQIVWPAYTDKQLDGGKVVTPDQSYTPSVLP
ncbi:hypothetical protein BDV18DRAFT_162356 [Aspergillus unguis]